MIKTNILIATRDDLMNMAGARKKFFTEQNSPLPRARTTVVVALGEAASLVEMDLIAEID